MSLDKRFTNNKYNNDDELSLNTLISSAMNNRKKIDNFSGSPSADNNKRYETAAFSSLDQSREKSYKPAAKMSVDQIVAETLAKKRQTQQTQLKEKTVQINKDDLNSLYSEDENQDLSIEDMVAKAMQKKKSANLLSVERIATSKDIKSDGYYDDEINDINQDKSFFARNKKKLILIISVASIFLILIGGAFCVFHYYYNKLSTDNGELNNIKQNGISDSDTVNANTYDQKLLASLKSGDQIMSNSNVTNILLVAEDLRDTSNSNSRGNTDVMMLISINKETKQITMSSFMRDMYMMIPGHYATKLNAAYSMGGCDLLKETIKQNFGISIDRYVLVNFNSFMKIVDAIGGIKADVTDTEAREMNKPMGEQNKLLGNTKGTDYMKSGGTYTLNPNQALAYCRIRYNTGDDYGRTKRQRFVIKQMIERSRNLSLDKMKKLLDDVLDDGIKTDITEDECLRLLYDTFTEYKNYDINQLQIPKSGTYSSQTIRKMQVLCPDFSANIKELQETIYKKTNVSGNDNIDINDYTVKTTTKYIPPATTTKKYSYTTTYKPVTTTTTSKKYTTTTTTTKAKTTTTTEESSTTTSDTSSDTEDTTTSNNVTTTSKPVVTPTQKTTTTKSSD